MLLAPALTLPVRASTTVMLATGSTNISLSTFIVALCLILVFVGLVLQRLRLNDQLNQVESALHALSLGDRSRRVGLARGPLKGVGKAVDDFADATARRLADAELVHSELEHLVTRDRLTGIGNRQHFEQQIELEAARGKRYHVPVSLVLVDVDHFKRINDTYGHSVGDSVLIDITRRMSNQLRDTDTIARWGGEEFAVITPCTPMLGAEILAEKLRKAVADTPFDIVGSISISAGIAQLLPGERAKHWVARADRFLYQAKQTGRNRVCSYAESERNKPPFILVWGEQFMTGQPGIDAEHAEIFRLANEIVLLHEGAPNELCVERLDALLSHLTHHFRSEETLLRDLGCPEHEVRTHAVDHRGLVTQAMDLRRRLLSGEVGLSELGDFIVRRVAVGHLVGVDLPLFASLATSTTLPIAGSDSPSLRLKLQRAFLG